MLIMQSYEITSTFHKAISNTHLSLGNLQSSDPIKFLIKTVYEYSLHYILKCHQRVILHVVKAIQDQLMLLIGITLIIMIYINMIYSLLCKKGKNHKMAKIYSKTNGDVNQKQGVRLLYLHVDKFLDIIKTPSLNVITLINVY